MHISRLAGPVAVATTDAGSDGDNKLMKTASELFGEESQGSSAAVDLHTSRGFSSEFATRKDGPPHLGQAVDLRGWRSGKNLNLNATSVATLNSARSSITQIDQAIAVVAQQRGDLGAALNQLASTLSYTEIEIEQIQASEAAIGDADFASEVSQFSRASIVSQTATAMLAQANVLPANALALL